MANKVSLKSFNPRGYQSVFRTLALAAVLLGVTACGAPKGLRVRVATASADELSRAENEKIVWYEFREGDVVPVQFGFLGAVDGGSERAALRAKRRFFLVMREGHPVQISFDGRTFAPKRSMQTVIAVVPRKDGNGAQLLWVDYLGEKGDPRQELKELSESK